MSIAFGAVAMIVMVVLWMIWYAFIPSMQNGKAWFLTFAGCMGGLIVLAYPMYLVVAQHRWLVALDLLFASVALCALVRILFFPGRPQASDRR